MTQLLEIIVFGLFKSLSDLSAFRTILTAENSPAHILHFRSKIIEIAQQNLVQNYTQIQLYEFLFKLRTQTNKKVLEKYQENLSLTSLGKEVFQRQGEMLIITNSYQQSVQDYLTLIKQDFEKSIIFGTESFFKHNLIGKPQPEVLMKFLEQNKLELPNENLIYVGDSSTDKKFAQNCGIKFQLFQETGNEQKQEQKIPIR